MKILVADDSATIRKILVNVLTELGYPKDSICEASDGAKAWNLLCQHKYDLLLTDWNMPLMSGLELVKKTRTISKSNRNLPIIMITTEGSKDEVLEALKAGVSNYIVKPFNKDVLKNKIEDTIKKASFML
ncbi:MAG: response regulator [Arcobacteraceae bacterium]|jgi:two-component system chemotaxis response regulator CheY|nr:response regulator [Arcobacteraceae bacterium]